MEEAVTVRKVPEDDGENSRWALFVGSEPVVIIRTSDTLPTAKAVEYLFKELVGIRQ